MSSLAQIEVAVTQLTPAEQEQLYDFLGEQLATHPKRTGLSPEEFQEWLKTARGAGNTGLTTDEIMAMTRGEE